MAEENTELNLPNDTPAEGAPSTEPTPREYSDVEQRAMEQGWVPEDQWQGTGKWRSAEDFLDRGELFSKIEQEKRQRQRLEAVVEDLKKHHKQVREVEFKRAIAMLKEEKKNALEVGDAERVVEIDEQIAETKEAQRTAQQEPAPQVEEAPNPHFVAWLNRNGWYNTDTAMKVFADEVAKRTAFAGERNPRVILEEVEKAVKKEFAHKFTNPNRAKPNAVEGTGGKGKSQTKDTFQLTDEETRVMNRFVKAGVMTKDEYIAEIKSTRGA